MAATWYCWHCYAKQDREPSERCSQCGGSPRAPADATFSDKLLWALGHPLVERRVIAAAALGERQEPRALARLKAMAADPDPYLALAAVRALAYYPEEDVVVTMRDVAEHGPAPARRVAREVMASQCDR
jgi:HEAT repeat protein